MNANVFKRKRAATALALAFAVTATVAVTAPGISQAAGKHRKTVQTRAVQTKAALPTQVAAADAAVAQAAKPRLVWRDEFNDGDYAGWTPASVPGKPGKSQAIFRPANLSFADGKLVVTTQRHCGTPDAAPTTGTCPAGTSVYTSGRLDRAAPLPNGDFRVAFKAQVPQNGKQGQRSALWLKNAKPYCVSDVAAARNQGELDVLEHYGAKKGRSFGVSHLSCGKDSGAVKAYQVSNDVAFDPKGYHVWSVERRGATFRYFVDSTLVGSATCGEGKLDNVGAGRCDTIVKQDWTYTIQGEVFAAAFGTGKLQEPREGRSFPPQKLKVDWVRVYAL